MIRIPAALLLTVIALALQPGFGAAQTLPLQREVPPVRWGGCPPAGAAQPVDSAAAVRAEQLAAEAAQAAILGDSDAANALLEEAVALDPASATLAYRLARTAEESGRSARSIELYCRFLALAPGSPDAREVRQRLDALTTASGFVVPAAAVAAFQRGLAAYDAADFPDAEQAFSDALEAAPAWGAPLYNRGLTRLARGLREPAAADLRRYLQQTPGAPEFDQVLDLLGGARGSGLVAGAAPRSPLVTLAAGLAVPGLGHLTTGRTRRGLLVLGGATAALATGFLVERVEVRCLSEPVEGDCPADQVLGEERSRPLLGPSVAVALIAGVVGAIDAYRGVVRENARAADPGLQQREARGQGIRFAAPDVRLSLAEAHLEIVRIRF